MALHPQARAALDAWAAGPAPHTLDRSGIVRMRTVARAAAAQEPREPLRSVQDQVLGGVPTRVYTPDEPRAVLLYAHGGGYVMGDLETHDAQCRRLALRLGCTVVAVDYRRPPEDPYPAAVDDVTRVLDAVTASADLPVLACGDSAGAALVLVAALRRSGATAGLLLVYPFLDPTCAASTYARTHGALDRADAQWFWEQYAAGASYDDPDLAPLRSTRLGTLPPVWVGIAEHDTLVEEDQALVGALREAGVPVRAHVFEGMVHGFWRHPALFDAAEEALAVMAGEVDRLLSGSSAG